MGSFPEMMGMLSSFTSQPLRGMDLNPFMKAMRIEFEVSDGPKGPQATNVVVVS